MAPPQGRRRPETQLEGEGHIAKDNSPYRYHSGMDGEDPGMAGSPLDGGPSM